MIVVIRQRIVDAHLGIVAPEAAFPLVHGLNAGDGLLEGVLDPADVVVNLRRAVDRDPELLDAYPHQLLSVLFQLQARRGDQHGQAVADHVVA